MAAITIATRTKESPNSKVGISFVATTDGRIMLSQVDASGMFGGSGLHAGQEILSINGTTMRGKTTSVVLATLKSLDRDVTIQAGPGKQSAMLNCSISRKGGDGRYTPPTETLTFNSQQASQVPLFLRSMGVSPRKWERVVESFRTELLPAVQQSLTMDRVLGSEMGVYTGKQMEKGYWGFGQESHHEKKVFLMTHQAAVLHSNVALVANNVVSKANALLNRHGVMAELSFTVKELPNYSTKQRGKNTINIPTAIKFTPIDDDDDGSTARATAGGAPLASAAVIDCVPVNDDDNYC